jgi:hypothetical protein
MIRTWKQSLYLLQPETLRWHRELFRLVWKRKSKAGSRKPKLTPETISLTRSPDDPWVAQQLREARFLPQMRRTCYFSAWLMK